MGASFYWQAEKGTHLPVGARSSFKEAFERLFGNMPVTLHPKDLTALQSASLVWGATNANDDNPFSKLCDALDKHESVRVWAEY